MRIVVGLAAILCATCVHAGDRYSLPSAQESFDKMETCKLMGEISHDNYIAKQAGKPMTPPNGQMLGHWLWPMYHWSLIYGSRYAVSDRDAYMRPATKCLDNYNRLSARFRATGIPLDESELR